MQVGVGLPMNALGGEEIVTWAKKIESGPFASVSAGERLTYGCMDPLIALTAVAVSTKRIRLMTSVICLPLHNVGVVAKQAATLDRLSNGRLSLGVGIGSRPQDYVVAPAVWEGRARKFEEQLVFLKRAWQGVPPVEGGESIGPSPIQSGGPELIIGAFAEKALRRVASFADGVRSFEFELDPEIHRSKYAIVKDAWREAGRSGKPRFIVSTHFAGGPNASDTYAAHAKKYYGYVESAKNTALAASESISSRRIQEFVKGCEEIGVDDLIFTVTTADGIESIDQLAAVISPVMGT